MICLFRNIERVANDALIQPHTLLQNRIDMFSADLEVIERTLSLNGITFTVHDEDSGELLVNEDTFTWKLPYVYCGTEPNNNISIGLKVSQHGGIGSDYT